MKKKSKGKLSLRSVATMIGDLAALIAALGALATALQHWL